MSKPSRTLLRLLGTFAVEVSAGRPASVCIRSRKARALLAYLAMKPAYRASREELATLLWGDCPDAGARQNLRQCLASLRRDLHRACDILTVDRETIGLMSAAVSVDAREFLLLSRSSQPDELIAAAALWQGEFLADSKLDIGDFDAWRRAENQRLTAAAVRVFETLCQDADANHHGERAIEAAERLVALDPLREDLQRTAIRLHARYKSPEAALGRAKLAADLLHKELGVAPDQATRALIDAIRRGEIEPVPLRAQDGPAPVAASLRADAAGVESAPACLIDSVDSESQSVAVPAPADEPPHIPLRAWFWHGRSRAAAFAALAVAAVLAVGAVAASIPEKSALIARAAPGQRATRLVVLPFRADAALGDEGAAFARQLTQDLTGYLARFGGLRVIADRTSELYGDSGMDLAKVGSDLKVPYAIVGDVRGYEGGLRVSFQLVDMAARSNLWSSDIQRDRSDPARSADELARGIARAFAVKIAAVDTGDTGLRPPSQVEAESLTARGRAAEQAGPTRDNMATALRFFEEALQRNPHNQTAMLGVVRVQLTAAMNFVDLEPKPDIRRAERMLGEILAKSPTLPGAHFLTGLLQKYRGQYAASLRSFERCLELNPSFLPAQGQIGDLVARMGEPQRGLDLIQAVMRMATPNDPGMGFWYLFAGEAELELGHNRAAVDWMMRADAFMPGSPLVQAWLASAYATAGDAPSAARHAALLRQISPVGAQRFMTWQTDGSRRDGRPRPRIFQGLQQALSASLG